MWRLYRLLNSLGTLLVGLLVGGVLFGVAGNCAYDEFFTPVGCTLAIDSQRLLSLEPQSLLRPSIVGLTLSVSLLGVLRWVAGRSYHYREALEKFDLQR